MDERSFMIGRIDALAENLNLAEESLNSQKISPELRKAVKIRFGTLIAKQKKNLGELRRNVDKGMQLQICSTSLKNISDTCYPLFREVLAFVEGALVRSAGMDNGICYFADALLDDLSYHTDISWARLTIMGEQEYFAQMAEIIRLRFPEFSIWNLPILGHEFGHLVSQELKTRNAYGEYQYAFQILQKELNISPFEMPHLREHFADVFATYTMGPAFACTCVILRFDPMTANLDWREHPSSAKRIYMILEALKKMDEAEGIVVRPYWSTIQKLDEIWHETVKVERLDDTTTTKLNNWLRGIYGLIDTELPLSKYNGSLRVQRLVQELLSESARLPSLQNDHVLSDILNATWLYRLNLDKESGSDVNYISQKAFDLCKDIMKTKAGKIRKDFR